MSDLKLIIDTSDTEAAISKTVQLENKIKQLASRFSRGSADTATYNKGLLEIKRSYEKLGLSSQKATAEVRKYAKAQLESIKASEQRKLMGKFLEQEAKTAARLEEEYRKLSLSQKSARDSAKAMEAAFKAKERAQEEATKAAKRENAETERLRNKFDQSYRVMEIYSRELNDLARARQKDIISAEQQKVAVDRLNKEMKEGTGVFASAANQYNRSTRGINNMGVQVQQAGYQIGDFIVQVQSGTNWMVAFGQQATQVAGTLTLLGGKFVAIGAALSIIIPLVTAFGAAWMRTRQDSVDALSDIEQGLQDILDKGKELRRARLAESLGLEPNDLLNAEAISKQIEIVEESLNKFQSRRATLDFLAGSTNTRDILEKIFGGTEEAISAQQRLNELRSALKDIEKDLARTQEENFQKEKQALTQRIALNDAIALMGEDSKYVEDLRHQQRINNINSEIQAMVTQGDITQDQADKLIQLAVNAEDAERRSQEVSEALQMVAGLELPIIMKINILKQELGLAANEAARLLENLPSDPLDPFGGKGDPAYSSSSTFNKQGPERTAGGGSQRQSLEDILKLRAEQIVQEERIARLSGETARIEEIKVEIQRQYGRGLTATQAKAVEAAAADIAAKEQTLKSLQDLKEQQESLASTIESSMEDAFMSIVDGTKSTEDAFKDMARSIIAQLYRVLVVKRLVGDVETGTGLAGLLGNFLGAMESGGSVRSGGTYLVGERGPELFTPGRSGTITSNNLMKSGGQQEVSVRVYVDNDGNFQAMVDQRANRAVANAAPAIVNQSVGAVVERTKRGGSMKSTFK